MACVVRKLEQSQMDSEMRMDSGASASNAVIPVPNGVRHEAEQPSAVSTSTKSVGISAAHGVHTDLEE